MIAQGLYRHWSNVPTTVDKGWRWPNWTARELACKHCGEYWHDDGFMDALQGLREDMAGALIANSGHRCRIHNKAVGGATRSQHLRIAIDVAVRGWSDERRRKLLVNARLRGFTGIGYAKTFLHLDKRPGAPVEWQYAPGGKAAWKALL